MIKRLLTHGITIFIFSFSVVHAQDQLATWDLIGKGGSSSVAATNLGTGIQSAVISFGPGLTPLVNSYMTDGFVGVNQEAVTLADAISQPNGGEYISIVITPQPGYSIDIYHINIALVSQNQTRDFDLLSNLQGFSATNAIGEFSKLNWGSLSSFVVSNHTNISNAVEFRVYINTPTPGTPNIYEAIGFGKNDGNDLIIEGAVKNTLTQNVGGTWSLQGNTLTGNQFLGSINNADVNIKTNYLNRITVSSTGDVMINSLQGTGNSIPIVDANGKLSRIGNGTVGQYLQNATNGPIWSDINNEWNINTFTSPNFNYPGTLNELINNWKDRTTFLSRQTQVVGELVAWQGIQVGGRDLFQSPPDKVNDLPYYGMGFIDDTKRAAFPGGISYNPVQIAGYNGIIMVDNTAPAGPSLKIQNGNVGIATGYNTALDQKFTVNGNIKILTTGNGIIFPDGTIQTTAGMNSTGGGDGFWNTAFTTSYTYTCIIHSLEPSGQFGELGWTNGITVSSDHNISSPPTGTTQGSTYVSCIPDPGSGQQVINSAIETSKDVGIGITSPLSKLHVVGDIRLSSASTSFVGGYDTKLFFGQGNNDNSDPLWISRYNIPDAAAQAGNALGVSDWTELRINIGDDGVANKDALAIGYTSYGSSQWNDAMKIYSNGNVRIFGKVISNNLKISTVPGTDDFPDYVFDPQYQLMPLNELKEYINLNKHLPEIPSAKEVKENGGFEVGSMNILLLKKVEELTIHLLKQQEVNAKLEERLLKLERNK